jgi:uncharacterized protein (TIGR03435 family)
VVGRLLICFFVATSSAAGHSQSSTSISIKPAASSDVQSRRTRVLPNGDLIATSVNAISLISYGYDAPGNPSDRLSQLSPWVYSERYDIEAKASPATRSGSLTNAPDSFRAVFREVLRGSFGLIMRSESKTVPVYSLVVAADGPKLKRSSTTGCVFDTAPDGCHAFQGGFGHPLNAGAIDMNDLAKYIGNWTDMPVVNRTNLSGLYSTSTSGWRPMHLPPPPPGGNGSDFSQLPTLDEVLLKLGLRLEKGNAAIPYFTAEHIAQPTSDQ